MKKIKEIEIILAIMVAVLIMFIIKFSNVSVPSTIQAPNLENKNEDMKNGIVYFEYENTNTSYYGDNGLVVRLKSVDLDRLIFKDLFFFDGAEEEIHPASNYAYHDGILYFVDKYGELNEIDASLTGYNRINLYLNSTEYVSDFFIKDNVVYYLAGPFCNFYRAHCNNSLRAFNMVSGTSTVFIRNMRENYIRGLDAAGSKIFLWIGGGDAGGSQETFVTFDLIKNEILAEDEFVFDYDQDEEDVRAEEEKRNKFLKNIERGITLVSYIRFLDGKLIFEHEQEEILNLINVEGQKAVEFIRVF